MDAVSLWNLHGSSVDAYWHPLTPEHGFPSLIYKTQGAPPQSATIVDFVSSFLKGKEKAGEYLCGILLQQSESLSYGGIIHIRYKGRRSHLPLSQFSEHFRCKFPCIFSYKIKTGDNPLAPPVKNPCI